MHLSELKQKTAKDLAKLASEHRIAGADDMRRQDLVFALLRAEAQRGGAIHAEGVLEILPDGFGFLRAKDNNYLPGPDDVYVSPSQIRRFNLKTGDSVGGQVRPPKESERYFALLRVELVNGVDPEAQRGKRPFDELTASYPQRAFTFARAGAPATALIDLLCPIGRGQRCLIAAPPQAGRTTLVRDLALSLEAHHPDCPAIILLVDERPEDVTELRGALKTEIVASTFDEPASRHVQIADIVLERAKRAAETGKDAVVLLDSLTRLARAFAAVEGNAQRAKRFFGAARHLAEGGSLTIIATALVGTDSRADESVHDEVKGAATSVITLSADLAARRIFPALDLARCHTNRDDKLLAPDAQARATRIRAAIGALDPAAALAKALDLLGPG